MVYLIITIAVSLFSLFILAIIRLAYQDGKKATMIDLETKDSVIEKTYLQDSANPADDADQLLSKLRADATDKQ